MSVASHAGAELSREAELFRQYLRWVAPATIAFVPVMALVAVWYPIPMTYMLAVGTLAVAPTQIAAYRLAGRDRVEAAVVLQAVGVWVIATCIGLSGKLLFPIAPVVAMVPVLIAIPFVSTTAVLRLSAGTITVVAVGAYFAAAGAALPPVGVPVSTVMLVAGCGVTANVGVCVAGLWYTRFTLDQASSSLEEANHALRGSEEKLERMVEQRTAELQRSQRALSQKRDEALAANRHKSAFLANMSHELRTPLNAIIGFSEVLGEGVFGELAEKQAEYVHDIHGSGHHLLSLINDILDLSKIEADRLELALAPFELAATLENAVVALQDRATAQEIDLRSDVPAEVGIVNGDERRVRQVLSNLLSNALKYTPAGGSVTLSARDTQSGVEVAIADTGIGIAMEDQDVIFEAFGKAGEAAADYSHAHEGTGVGLAVTKRLVELHGGRLWVESEPGQGSTFRFSLPREAVVTVPADDPATA